MRQISILLILLMAWVGISSATSESVKEAPAISFKVKSYDFGTIKEADGPVTCQFKFSNSGNAPLVIISANAGCGCTTPTFPDEPVLPGKSSEITVKYNPKGRPGEFNKTVTVRTNDPKSRKVTLKISGTVVPKD